MLIANLLAGGLLLAFGRRLFWLFVAACGFAVALTLTNRFLETWPDWLAILTGLGIGVLGALLALFFQWLAIGVAGFLAGALIATRLLDALGLEGAVLFWIALLIGGLCGAALMEIVFDWGLVGLSCLVGSSLIVKALQVREVPGILLWLSLFVLGVAIQVAQRHPRANRGSSR